LLIKVEIGHFLNILKITEIDKETIQKALKSSTLQRLKVQDNLIKNFD